MSKPGLMPPERIPYMMCVEIPQILDNRGEMDPGAMAGAAAAYAMDGIAAGA
jgi:hypothetical protein